MNRLDRIKRLSDIVQKLLDDVSLSYEERRLAWLAAHNLRTAEALESAAKKQEDVKPKVTLGQLPDGLMERAIAQNVARGMQEMNIWNDRNAVRADNEFIRFDRSRFLNTQEDADPVTRQAAEAVRQRAIDAFTQMMQHTRQARLETPF